jgi:NAD(P)-dependent dehydrogenase (short-subunit alcohol dehydrogenase family)
MKWGDPVANTKQRVVVVTGGAAGIGAAIAEELGRIGAFVVTLDPVVSVDGSSSLDSLEQTTADRIIEAGGTARASNTSVTDQEAVQALFAGLVEEFGSLDAVVNVAGISRPTDFASGTEDDWAAVLNVHLDGYLNVLNAALPIMAKAGHGQILGVTSGSGWRPANVGAYGCAKRAVAALTWQIGRTTPPGVTVNALSPIAATRMVTGGLAARPPAGAAGSSTDTGGLNLGSMPPPENLGPVGAYLAGEEFSSWCQGQIIFSGGSEVAWLAPPRLLEVARSADVTSLPHALETVMPVAFATAEAAQTTNGGSNPRYGPVFDEPAAEPAGAADRVHTCVIVSDDDAWGGAISDALASQGVKTVRVSEPAQGFAAAADQINRAADEAGPLDAVVLALRGVDGGGGVTTTGGWRQVLDEHAGIAGNVRTDAGWVRAVSDYSAKAERPVRVVTVTNATSFGGRSRAQSAAQLARAAHMATSGRMDAFAISVETAQESELRSLADVVAYLACSADSAALSGAELVVASGWFGLRSHPAPAATISFGGPAIPEWLDGTLRTIVTASPS